MKDKRNPVQAMPCLKKAIELRSEKSWYWLLNASSLSGIRDCQAVGAFQQYLTLCRAFGTCNTENVQWAEKTAQRMIWKEDCWREHPTLKLLGRLVKWLPSL